MEWAADDGFGERRRTVTRKTSIIGIDPGYRTGIAIVSVAGVFCSLIRAYTCSSRDVFGLLASEASCPDLQVCAVQTPIMPGKTARWHRGDRSGVGLAKNAALAGEIIGFLRGRGYEVIAVPPGRGHGMKSQAAFDMAFGNRIPSGRISEHARDAAMLALHADGLQAAVMTEAALKTKGAS
jgi:hypothetical protein